MCRLDQPWFRLHASAYDALYWGRTPPRRYAARFDDPEQHFGVLYAAADEQCAFIETFGQVTGIRSVGWDDLRRYALRRIETDRPTALVDLTGPGLAHLGADARLFAGEYTVAQRWSRALYGHPDQPDGIYYRSRHDPSRMCVALFDRIETHVTAIPVGLLSAPGLRRLLGRLLDTYQFGVHGR